jgi:hypothetical protein
LELELFLFKLPRLIAKVQLDSVVNGVLFFPIYCSSKKGKQFSDTIDALQ